MRKMPKLISAYVKASNDQDMETFGTLFKEDAIVHDEGIEHRGVAAIQGWLAATAKKYAFTLKPINVSRQANETILTVQMAGAFPGSPLSARFCFVIHEGQIARLDIRS
jgi:hypothetical protein